MGLTYQDYDIKEILNLDKDVVYFNSGVILFNLEKIRKRDILSEAEKILDSKLKQLKNPDQDILNILYSKDKIIVPWEKWNYQVWDKCVIEEKPAVIH